MTTWSAPKGSPTTTPDFYGLGKLGMSRTSVITFKCHNHRGDKDTKRPVAYSREAGIEDNQPTCREIRGGPNFLG